MTELPIKMDNTHIKYLIMKWAVVIKLFRDKYIQKIHFELKNVHTVLGILLKTILKIGNSCFYENFYSKSCRMLPVFYKLFGYFLGKENILCIFLKAYISWSTEMEWSFNWEILIDINQCANPRKFTWNLFPKESTNHFPRSSFVYQ